MITYCYGALKPRAGFGSMLQMLRVANQAYNDELEARIWRSAALHVGRLNGDDVRDEVKALFNARERELYRVYAPQIGHQTLNHLRKDAGISAAKRWRCWSRKGRWLSPFSRSDGTGYLSAGSQDNARAFAVLRPDTEKRGRRDARHAVCSLRVLSGQTIEIPVVLDRPLPVDADIAQARFNVRREGDRWLYSLTFCVRNYSARELPRGVGACSVNFGWRRMPSGNVRIATVVGEHGQEFLELPAMLIGARKHAESLGSLADECAAAHLGSARARHRSRREALRGKGPDPIGRVQFDPAVHSDREHWARRDRHLWQWESAERAKSLLQRREIYRLWVRALRARYATVTVESYSMAALARQATSPEAPREQAARHIRQLVAPGWLRSELRRVFGDDCKDLCQARRTKRCGACRKMCAFDAASELVHECEHCGAVWDQDVNNATNQQLGEAAE